MTAKIMIGECLLALRGFAQGAPTLYVYHTATRSAAQTPGTGLAPGSLCDIDTTFLYLSSGGLRQEDSVTLRFRAPAAAGARVFTIIANETGLNRFTSLIPSHPPPRP